MTPRVFRWAIVLSWSLIGLTVALMVGGVLLGRFSPPAWGQWVAAVAYLVGLPVGLWSPIGLVFSHARSRDALRTRALAGLVLTLVSSLLTLVVLTDGNTYMPAAVWHVLSRVSLPVMLLTLAVAFSALASMTPAGPRAGLFLKSGVASMSGLAALVTGMVVADSGNRLLFGVLAVLLGWAMLQLPVMVLVRRRAAANAR